MIKANKRKFINICSNLISNDHKGITLVALIMTVIIMLILAGVTINIALDGGLFGMTKEAAKQTEIAAQIEKIEAERINILVEQISKGLTSKEFMDRYEEELRKSKDFEGAVITRKDDTTIVITTKEGYVFEITEEGTNYTGDKTGGSGENPEEPKPPELNKSNTNFTYDPSTWTNGEVKVGISTEVTGYTLQYSFDNSKWENYTGEIPMSANGPIYARLKDDKGQGGTALAGNVSNIDTDAPIVNTSLSAKATNVVGEAEVSIEVTDSKSGLSKIEWHYKPSEGTDKILTDTYKEMNKAEAGETERVEKTRKITGLTPGETYSMYAEVYDVAGKSARSPETGTVSVTIPLAVWRNENSKITYLTMEQAFNAANEGETLTLLGSYTDSSAPTLNTTVTVDIGRYELTKTGSTINIASGGKLFLYGTGKIKTSDDIHLITNSGTLRLYPEDTERKYQTVPGHYNKRITESILCNK